MIARGGLTLIELVVVIALIGIMTAVTSLALPPARTRADSAGWIGYARDSALRSGTAVVATHRNSTQVQTVFALPDGSVIADSALQVDRLTGRRPSAFRGKR